MSSRVVRLREQTTEKETEKVRKHSLTEVSDILGNYWVFEYYMENCCLGQRAGRLVVRLGITVLL